MFQGFACIGGNRDQQRFFAIDKIAGIKRREFETVAVGDSVRGAGFYAIAAEDAAIVVNVIDLGIAFRAADTVLFSVLRRLNVNAIGRAGRRAQEAGHAFFQAIFIALQLVQSAETLLKHRAFIGQLLIGIVLNNGGSKHLTERDGHSFGNAENISEDRHGNSIMANCLGDKILSNRRVLQLALAVSSLFISALSFGQAPAKPDWSGWNFMVGEWTAAQTGGQLGQTSSASFSLKPDLQGAVLLRRNHAEYPASNGRPAIVHDDLMTIYQENGATKAFYVDSEGQTIRYDVNIFPDKKKVVMMSEKVENTPRFRLTYSVPRLDALNITFEIAPPGKTDEFKVYVQGIVERKK